MRSINTVAAAALSILASSMLFGQSSQGLSITHYQVVSTQPANGSQSYVTYKVDLVNPGSAQGNVTALVSSLDPFSIRLQPGQDTLTFTAVGARSTTPSNNTFTILYDANKPLDTSKLLFTFQSSQPGPFANPGPDQSARVGQTVTLDGSGSTEPSGGSISYNWVFSSRPTGSSATISNSTSVRPTFVPDAGGKYVVTLTVISRFGGASADVMIDTTGGGAPPVANAGPDQVVATGATVTLNGSGSTTGGGSLTYAWTLTSVPAGSTATLSGANTISPTFVADKAGSYTAQLIVNDGASNSQPDTVVISTTGTKPVANAGPPQRVNVGSAVQLNGSASTDAGGKPLTYKWSLISIPAGSSASLNSTTVVNPTFLADRPGTYIAQLIVNNGQLDSDPQTVMITTDPLKPTANPGVNQTVAQGATVQLTGSGTDPQNLPLTFKYTLVSKPPSSSAALSSTVIATPTFVADQVGNYVVQLVTNNGFLDSDPKTVTISTVCAQPTANAGSDQQVPVGTTVTLDGSKSGDVCHDPLTYSWTFTTRPASSTAVLAGANTASPSFTADVEGTFVVQLIVNNGLTSTPSTVTITAGGNAILLTPNPLNLGTTPGNLIVILAQNVTDPAGQVINLSSTDTSLFTVPSTVTIPFGNKAANFAVTPTGLPGTAQVKASAAGLTTGTTTVTVAAPTISVKLDASVVGVGFSTNGTVTLSSPAPAGGLSVTLTGSPNGLVSFLPTPLLIGVGTTTANFTVTGVTQGQATITANAPNFASGSTSLTVGSLGLIRIQPGISVGLGQSVPLNINLVTGAPAGGVTITLTSSDPTKATVPATVFIPARERFPVTQPLVTGVGAGTVNITASANGFTGDTQAVTVTIGLSFNPSNVTFTGTKVLNLNLSSAAPPAGMTVNLSSDDPTIATVPTTATFIGGTSSVAVTVTGLKPGTTTIRASAPNVAETTASVTVAVVGSLALSATPQTLAPGQSTSLQLTLSDVAPAGGVFVTLTSSDTSKVTVVPANVLIPQGAKAPLAAPTLNGIGIGAATISANASGYAQASIVETVGATVSFNPPSVTIAANNTTNFTLTLSAPAPAGGLTVNLSSDNPLVATVPATATFLAGTSTVIVQVTAVANGATTIHAGGVNVPDATATINVTQAVQGSINVPASLTLALGPPITFPITLSQPATGGGVTLLLTSSNPTAATISPSSVFVAAGSTTPATPAQVRALGFGASTITVTGAGYTTGTSSVQVNSATVSFSPSSLTVTVPSTQSFTLTLSAPAPASGLTVNLSSSDPSKATVPSTATFAPNGTTVTVPVTGVSAGSVTIHASALPNVADSTAHVDVVMSLGIILPSGVVLTPGQTVDFPVTLATAAPANGAFVTLSSGDTTRVTITPASIFIPSGETTSVVPPKVTGLNFGSSQITATASGIGSATTQVLVGSTGGFTPPTLTITGTTTQSLQLTFASPAPAGGLTVNLSSSNPLIATVPSTVTVPANAISVSVPVTGVSSGQTTITASSLPIIPSTTALVTVISSPAVILPPYLSVGQNLQAPIPVTLSTPAPAGGVTITLASSDPSFAFITPATVFVPAGATAPAARPLLNGTDKLGYINVTASAPGYKTALLEIKITDNLRFGLQDNVSVGLGQTIPISVSLPGLPGGVTISLVSSDTNKLTVTPSVFVPAGETLPTNLPLITGVGLGDVKLEAINPAFTSTIQNVRVFAIMSFSQQSQTIGTSLSNLTLNLSGPAPAGGLVINLFTNNPAAVTVPSSVSFAPGATSVTVPVTGVAPGTAVITAATNAPNLSPTATTITVISGGNPSAITVSSASVGQNLETTVSVGIPQAAPAGGQQVTLSSSDSSKAVVAAQATDAGAGSVSLTVPAGQTSINAYVQGLASSGAVTLTASSNGFTAGSGTVSLTPSGIVLAGPGGVGAPNFTTSQGQNTTLTLSSARLDSSLNFAGVQALRGGFNTSVNVTSSSPGVGTITTSPVNLNGGSSNATTQFNAASSGSATLTAVVPSGFSQPAQGGNIVTANVAAQTPLSPASVTVGKGLEVPASVSLTSPAQAGGLVVTLTSNDPNSVLLSTTPTGSGSSSISVTIPAGATQSPNYYIYGLANSGSATYSASASGFGTSNGTVTLAPSGIVVAGPAGVGVSTLSTTPGAPATTLTVYSALLTQGLAFVAPQAIAGGSPVSVNVTSSNTNIGTIAPSPVSIAGGSSSSTTQFQPANGGTTTLSVNTPSGFSTPSNNTSLSATVGAPAITVTDNATIGQNLEVKGTVSLGQIAPAGGYSVTLKANNVIDPNLPNGGPRRLLISPTATDAGLDMITITIPAGSSSADYYLQALDGVGTISYTVSSPGFSTVKANVNLVPSGLVIAGPLGLGIPFPVSVSLGAGGTTPLTIYTARLDPYSNKFVEPQMLAGGLSVTTTLNSTNSSIGSVTTPITINGGSDRTVSLFTPQGVGTTNVTIFRTVIFQNPADNRTITINVTP